jgi:hypothetical protein
MSMHRPQQATLALVVALIPLVSGWPAPAAQLLPPLDKLESRTGIPRDGVQVRLVTGSAEWRRGPGAWAAIMPDQICREGDELRTGGKGMLVLELPLQAGFVNVLAGSLLRVHEMQRLPGFDGAQSATLVLNNGKAFVRLRKFNRKQSRFRVNAPNGSAVVRGTEFVVATATQGLTATTTIGVTSGLVQVEAQGKTVNVPPGKTSTIVGASAPTTAAETPAVPIRLTRFLPKGDLLDITGTAAPGASVVINGFQALVDTAGTFQIQVPLASDARQITIEALEPTGHVETLSVSSGQ